MLNRTLAYAAIAVVFAVVVGGCSGGGKVNLPSTRITTTFTVLPDQDTDQVAGDLKVHVPAGTFGAQSSRVDVTRYSVTDLPTADKFSSCANPGCEVRWSQTLQGTFTLEWAQPPQGRTAANLALRYLKKINGKWQIISNVANDAKIVIDKTGFAALNYADGVVGNLLIKPPETTTGIVEQATNPGGNGSSAWILIHGYNASAAYLQLAADRIAQETGILWPRKVFGFVYDYRQHPNDSAIALAEQITKVRAMGFANITIFAHSLGVAVARDALENHGIAKYVGVAYLINGANHGSVWTKPAEVVKNLEELLLNDSTAGASGIYATLHDPVIEDLIPGSPFLTDLNAVKSARPIKTSYVLVGTDRDTVVGQNGGAPNDIPFERKTTGAVRIITLTGDHSELVNREVGIDRLFGAVFHVGGSYVTLTIDPGPEAYAAVDGWDYKITVTNDGSSPTVVKNISVETFDYNGVWEKIRSMTTDHSLQEEYIECNKALAPYSHLIIQEHEWVDDSHNPVDNVPTDHQARTLYITVRYTEGNKECYRSNFITLRDGNIVPHNIIWRSRR